MYMGHGAVHLSVTYPAMHKILPLQLACQDPEDALLILMAEQVQGEPPAIWQGMHAHDGHVHV